ncbi:MAG TPA: hypothetical protein VI039_04930 [Solirubrobacterales bacterium]
MSKRSLALLLICLGGLLALPVMAQADTPDILAPQNEPSTQADGWQAGTCNEPECIPESPDPVFFTQAGGHPPFAFTQYTVKQETVIVEGTPREIPVGTVGRLRVDLPPGLIINPQATVDTEGNPIRCKMSEFNTPVGPTELPGCPASTQVGVEKITLKVIAGPGTGTPVAPIPGVTEVPVYNLEPEPGQPAKFGFKAGAPGEKSLVFLRGDVAWESDFHAGFVIDIPPPKAVGATTRTWKSRLINIGDKTGNGMYINLPTTCFDPEAPGTDQLYSTWARASTSVEEESGADATFPFGYTPFEAKLPEGIGPTGCENVPFEPSIDVNAGTGSVDSPAPATVTAKLPFKPETEGDTGIVQSHVRKAEVALPKGMGLNPSGAQGLVACSDAQFKKGVRTYTNECPAASDIGSVEVDSWPLANTLVGDVYVGEQKSSDPESGDLFRILIEAKNEEEGINARLVGRVKANKTTGELVAEVTDQLVNPFFGPLPAGLPQVPFEEVRLRFDGSKEVLTSPPVCSAESTSRLEPWARPGTFAEAKSKVTLSTDPTGGPCPATMAERKFSPLYKAKVDSSKGGAYSPFHVNIGRRDGEQELKVVDVTLPKGLTGKLAGIPYCSEEAIAAAAGKSGNAEKSSPSCSGDSFIGKVTTKSGSGANPLQLSGNAYLAGPYKGAALSLVTITPAVAGPFDLGTVVVRVALNVDPETAQIHAVSDLIPNVFGGVKLDIRSIDLDIDRSQFMLNPTSCAAQATTGAINGGGADPANPATFSSYAVNDPFQATECNKLAFKPKLNIQLFGGTARNKYPRLKATLTARKGDANIGRTAVTMPRSLFLEQGHIGTVCTRPQLASHTCPKASVYGKAWAKSPLLSKKLQGKVYLVSSNNKLPDLLVDLRGQVEIYLRGVIGSGSTGGLKTVFRKVPDVPVSKFVLNMKGGKKSLLVNSVNTCAKPQRAIVKMKAQNGKKKNNNKFKLNIASCNKKKGK